MSEQNMDKFFKEKLSGIEPTYEAADWQQMEAMLDSNGKSRIAAYWWWGAALLLLLSVGGIGWFQLSDATVNEMVSENSNAKQPTTTDREVSFQENDCDEASLDQHAINTGSKGSDELEGAAMNEEINLLIGDQYSSGGDNSGSSFQQGSKESSNSLPPNGLTASLSNADEHEMLQNDRVFTQVDGPLQISMLLEDEIIGSGENGIKKVCKEETLDIGKRKRMRYSLALEGGIHQSFMQTATFTKPGYSAGLSFEALYNNRVGFGTGIRFTKWNYQVKEPLCEFGNCPTAFTSNIRGFEIPLNIRVNVINGKRMDFYVTTGVSAMLVLKEEINYDIPEPIDTTIVSNPTNTDQPMNIYLPGGFNSNTPEHLAELDAALGGLNPQIDQADIVYETATQRFVANYHVSAGIEYSFGPGFSWQIEPGYTMTLHKVGVLQKRLHTASINTRLRYYFGRR